MLSSSRQSADQDHFDLLPFIGIMMCLLGTLLLVTMSMGAINIGAGAAEGWSPEPDPNAKIPVLIEWDGKYATWHSDSGLQRIENDLVRYINLNGTWIRVDANDKISVVSGPSPSSLDPLINYLESHRQTHYALFAVRPSGFDTFPRFQRQFKARNIEVGSEPIEQVRPVHLLPAGGNVR